MRAKRKIFGAVCGGAVLLLFAVALFFWVREGCFPRPYKNAVAGGDSALVYAVMKAESGFHEDAVSKAGAVGVMQLLPETAEYVCKLNKIAFDPKRLTEGEYNARLGCLYLKYLAARFEGTETVLAAYNAGEGTVTQWLKSREYSSDGKTLHAYPYPETERYVKKVMKFRKIYSFFYHEST